jgi:hypothetical protein
MHRIGRTIGRGTVLGVAVVQLLMACGSSSGSPITPAVQVTMPSLSPSPTAASFPIPNGTFIATPTRREELAKGFTTEYLDRFLGAGGSLTPYTLVFENGTYHDVVEGADGVKQVGDLGTYTATEKLLILTSETPGCLCTYTYRWSFDGTVLSLKLVSGSAGPADFRNVRLVTEHDYVKVG